MGGKKKTTKQNYIPPEWVTSASKKAIGLGEKIADRPYEAYTGDRIAALSQNEQRGIDLAGQSVGTYQPYFDKSEAALDRASTPFTEANMQDYMNPYIKGALDPAAREIRQAGAQRLTDLQATQKQRGAFGGSRGALLESEAQRGTETALGDLYGQGYARAFEFGTQQWNADREASFKESGMYTALGQLAQQGAQADISTLMATGAQDRMLRQAAADFDYEQFAEARDWDVKNLAGLLAAIQGTQGSYGTEQKTVEKTSGGMASKLIGMAATVAAAYFTGGASLAAGAAASGSDRRFKTDIIQIGTTPGGTPLYSYRYKWGGGPQIGVMADEAPAEAVFYRNGYGFVDYSKVT